MKWKLDEMLLPIVRRQLREAEKEGGGEVIFQELTLKVFETVSLHQSQGLRERPEGRMCDCKT